MASFSELSDELLLALLQYCDIESWMAVGLTCRRFSSWFNERIFWISALKATKRSRPVACPFHEDLSRHSLVELKDIGLRTLRLERNWGLPRPEIIGPLYSVDLGNSGLDIIFQVPGTRLYLLHSRDDGMIACWDMRLGKRVSSSLHAAPRIIDVSPGQEDPESYSMGLLMLNDSQNAVSMAIVKVVYGSSDDEVTLSQTFECNLPPNHLYWAMFLTREVVGVIMDVPVGHGHEVAEVNVNILAYNIASKSSTLIETDIRYPESPLAMHSGSSTASGDLFILVEKRAVSYVQRLPRSLLPTDDKVVYPARTKFGGTDTEYCNTIYWSDEPGYDREGVSRSLSEGALSADSYYGVPATSLHRHIIAGGGDEEEDGEAQHDRSRIEVRFWTSNKADGDSQARHTLQPHCSSYIQGIVHQSDGSAWRLLLIPHSGRILVMVLDVKQDEPVLILVRFHVERKECTVHTLELPDEIPLSDITGLAVDDYCGAISLLSSDGIMFLVSYA